MEELILEAVAENSKNIYSKMIIKRGVNNGLYYCHLSLNPEEINSTFFQLGTYFDAER